MLNDTHFLLVSIDPVFVKTTQKIVQKSTLAQVKLFWEENIKLRDLRWICPKERPNHFTKIQKHSSVVFFRYEGQINSPLIM